MFEKDILALDVGSAYIKAAIGNSKEVKSSAIIRIPEGSMVEDRIIDTEPIVQAIRKYVESTGLRVKSMRACIQGQDVVIRHTECPIMDESAVFNSVSWEIGQNLPRNGEDYYISYEILDKVNLPEKRMYKLLVVAAPRERVNNIVEISKKLDIEIDAVDVNANCVARMFKQAAGKEEGLESVAIIDMGNRNTDISIMDDGKLYMERELPFGMKSLVKEMQKREEMESEEAMDKFLQEFDFQHPKDDEMDRKVLFMFDNVLSSLEKVIQFYSMGRTKKNIDKIYLIGGGCVIRGMEEYISSYFGCPVEVVDNPQGIGLNMKASGVKDFRFYLSTLGLLLRKE